MSEIAQIVEGNNAKILSSYVSNHNDSNMIKLTLKLNANELSHVVQTFQRYDYTITAHTTSLNLMMDYKIDTIL